jgi:UDP-N-acetylmuramoylalanine--D-glutamate ligase
MATEHYRKAAVLGMGESGKCAARLLLFEGSSVDLYDSSETPELEKDAAIFRNEGAGVMLGAETVSDRGYDVCIVSPGVPKDSSLLMSIGCGVPVLSELEFGSSRCNSRILAVTGTNGKSTASKFCYDAMCGAGIPAAIGGNYGTPVSGIALSAAECEWLVLEVSSFQLEHVRDFSPEISILLNIQPDHLDRHGTLDEYRRCKARLFDRMGKGDLGIVSEGEADAIKAISSGENNWLRFGSSESADCCYLPGLLRSRMEEVPDMDISGSYFDNPVLGLTAAASAAALRCAEVPDDTIYRTFSTFEPLEHRMEPVRVAHGVRFVDDSKATNLTAMKAGIEMTEGSVRLIAGGLLKEKNPENFKEVLAKGVASVYLIGKASEQFEKAWGDVVDCVICDDLATAVHEALKDASEGDTVLLSPGCASFDQFKNYKDRGNQFKEIVNKEIS